MRTKVQHLPGDQIDIYSQLARLSEQIVRLDGRITDERSLTDAKFITLEGLMRMESEKTAVALNAADKAALKLENSYNERFALLNELRSGVATAEQLDALIQRLDDLKTRMDRQEGHGAGAKDNKTALYTILGLGFTLVIVIIALMNYITSH